MGDASKSQDVVPAVVWVLGLGGLIPFVVSAGVLAVGGAAFTDVAPVYVAAARVSLTVYAAVILSFLGGAHWGRELAAARPAALAAAVSPSVAGWFAVVIALPPLSQPLVGLVLLMLGFLAFLAYDLAATRAGFWPPWYGRVRLALSLGAVASLAVAVGFWGPAG